MQSVFDQHTEMDHDGIVTGGKGKLLCFNNWELNKKTVWNLVKTPCWKIIEELRALFRDYYLFVDVAPNLLEDPVADGSSTDEDERKQGLRVQEATKKLSSSEWILETGIAESGKAEDRNEEMVTYTKRRRGRLPPRSTGPSRDSLRSQGTYSHPHTRVGSLLGSSSHSATRISTGSLSPSYSAVPKPRPRVDDN